MCKNRGYGEMIYTYVLNEKEIVTYLTLAIHKHPAQTGYTLLSIQYINGSLNNLDVPSASCFYYYIVETFI